MEANVFQLTVDYPEEYAEGFHVALDDGKVVTLRRDQVKPQTGRRLSSPCRPNQTDVFRSLRQQHRQ